MRLYMLLWRDNSTEDWRSVDPVIFYTSVERAEAMAEHLLPGNLTEWRIVGAETFLVVAHERDA